jgi:hypothetical protein
VASAYFLKGRESAAPRTGCHHVMRESNLRPDCSKAFRFFVGSSLVYATFFTALALNLRLVRRHNKLCPW